MLNLVIYLAVAALCGVVAGNLMNTGFNIIMNILLGIGGGIVGNLVLGLIGFSASNIIGSIISSILGACIIIFVVKLLAKKR